LGTNGIEPLIELFKSTREIQKAGTQMKIKEASKNEANEFKY